MNLFDPYSHTRILELREEQLARRARRREALRLDAETRRMPIADIVRRIALRSTVKPQPASRPSGRPALDS